MQNPCLQFKKKPSHLNNQDPEVIFNKKEKEKKDKKKDKKEKEKKKDKKEKDKKNERNVSNEKSAYLLIIFHEKSVIILLFVHYS